MKNKIVIKLKQNKLDEAYIMLVSEIESDLYKLEKKQITSQELRESYKEIYKEISKVDAPSWVWDCLIEIVDISEREEKIDVESIRFVLKESSKSKNN